MKVFQKSSKIFKEIILPREMVDIGEDVIGTGSPNNQCGIVIGTGSPNNQCGIVTEMVTIDEKQFNEFENESKTIEQ